MTKSKKIVIGVLSLLILTGGYYVYLGKNSTYKNYCYYYQNHKEPNKPCYDSFMEKCKNTNGVIIDNTICGSPCPKGKGIICSDVVECSDLNVICKCPFIQRWKDEIGCTYF